MTAASLEADYKAHLAQVGAFGPGEGVVPALLAVANRLCHDSWDQCPCAEGGHGDGCDCCGLGICGPLRAKAEGVTR